MAARIAVNVDPVAASHMSGAARSRCPRAETSATMASTIAVATTPASHVNARTPGDLRRCTGARSLAREPIRRSVGESVSEGVFMALFPRLHFIPKRLQRAMQIDLERARSAPRQRGGIRERTLLQHEMLHGFPLACRQTRDRS